MCVKSQDRPKGKQCHFSRTDPFNVMAFSKRNKLTCVLALAVATAGCSGHWKDPSQAETDRVRCRNQMRSAAYCVIQYRADHDEQFPKSLEEAVSGEIGLEMAKSFIQCPAGGSQAKYIYVDWSRWFTNGNVPKDYPLVYESNSNKHGDGVNVVRMDLSAFWDGNARWITRFIREHPEYDLKIPVKVKGSVLEK
jgi:hypothetical protein